MRKSHTRMFGIMLPFLIVMLADCRKTDVVSNTKPEKTTKDFIEFLDQNVAVEQFNYEPGTFNYCVSAVKVNGIPITVYQNLPVGIKGGITYFKNAQPWQYLKILQFSGTQMREIAIDNSNGPCDLNNEVNSTAQLTMSVGAQKFQWDDCPIRSQSNKDANPNVVWPGGDTIRTIEIVGVPLQTD